MKKSEQESASHALNEQYLIECAKYGYNFHKTSAFPDHDFNDACVNNFKQWLAANPMVNVDSTPSDGDKQLMKTCLERAAALTNRQTDKQTDVVFRAMHLFHEEKMRLP